MSAADVRLRRAVGRGYVVTRDGAPIGWVGRTVPRGVAWCADVGDGSGPRRHLGWRGTRRDAVRAVVDAAEVIT